MYYATAYRWGKENGHHYFVFASPDKHAAIDAAEQECVDRGGKYGVVVREQGEEVIVAYFPSLDDRDAEQPHFCNRIHNREWLRDEVLLVYRAHERAKRGQSPISEQDKRRASWPMPEWLWELCEALDKDGGL